MHVTLKIRGEKMKDNYLLHKISVPSLMGGEMVI